MQVAPDEVVDLCSGDGHVVVRGGKGKEKGKGGLELRFELYRQHPCCVAVLLCYIHHMNLAFGIRHRLAKAEVEKENGKR